MDLVEKLYVCGLIYVLLTPILVIIALWGLHSTLLFGIVSLLLVFAFAGTFLCATI